MANRVFLIESSSSNGIVRNGEPDEALAASSNSIPVYWISLFESKCLISNEVILQDGARYEYPYLVVPVADAKVNIMRRRANLESVNPRTGALMTEQWSRFIDQVELPFIHLDAAELWMMVGDDEFKDLLQTALKVFELPSGEISALGANDAWLGTLELSRVDPDDVARTATPVNVMGYSWGTRRVPWDHPW